jgi:hypothetical protein
MAGSSSGLSLSSEASSPPRKQRRSRGSIWEHFSLLDAGAGSQRRASCRTCGAVLSFSPGTTSNLYRHVRARHFPRLRSPRATSVADDLTRVVPYAMGSASYAERLSALAEFVVANGLPLRVVETPRFLCMLRAFDRRFTPPTRRALKAHIFRTYECERDLVREQCRVAPSFSLSMDGWTSLAQEGYIGIVAHFITEWRLLTRVLALRVLSDVHTATNLADITRTVLGDLVPFSVTTDNGANYLKAVHMLGTVRVSCACHTLQLVVRQSLGDGAIVDVIARCRRIVGHLRHSTVAAGRLRERCQEMKLKKCKVIADVATRWNSSLHMLERMWELRAPIAAVLSDGKGPPALDPTALNLLEGLVRNLKPFESATEALSAETRPTASVLLPLLQHLRRHLQVPSAVDEPDGLSRFRESASAQLHGRFFSQAETMKMLCKCSLVDPRFKGRVALEGEDPARLLTAMCASHPLRDAPAVIGRVASLPSQPPNPLDMLVLEEVAAAEPEKDEIKRYLAEADILATEDPLVWWSMNNKRFPHVASLAIIYLAIPASGASVERLFSCAGDVVQSTRCRMAPATAEMLVLLRRLYV